MKDIERNHVTVQGWMRTKLNLKGNELLVYALIFGFSQDGESEFNGSRTYIGDWFGISLPTVDTALDNLVSKNLIFRRTEIINNIRLNRYRVNLTALESVEQEIEDFRGSKEILGGSKEILPGVVKNLDGGSKNSLHNNINKVLEDNIDETLPDGKEAVDTAVSSKNLLEETKNNNEIGGRKRPTISGLSSKPQDKKEPTELEKNKNMAKSNLVKKKLVESVSKKYADHKYQNEIVNWVRSVLETGKPIKMVGIESNINLITKKYASNDKDFARALDIATRNGWKDLEWAIKRIEEESKGNPILDPSKAPRTGETAKQIEERHERVKVQMQVNAKKYGAY